MKKQLKFLPSWWIPAEKQRFLEAALPGSSLEVGLRKEKDRSKGSIYSTDYNWIALT
jgi:hypothetical protein